MVNNVGNCSTTRSCFSAVLCSLSCVLKWTLSSREGAVSRSVFRRRQPPVLHHSVSCLLNPNPAFASLSCSAHLLGPTWRDLFVRPPHHQPSWHFNLCSWQHAQCHSCLAEWAPGCQAMCWHTIESKPGMLERAAKRRHNGLAVEPLSGQRAWSTMDKWSIKPLVTGTDAHNLILCLQKMQSEHPPLVCLCRWICSSCVLSD